MRWQNLVNGIGLLLVILFAVFTQVLASSNPQADFSNVYGFLGFFFLVFGIWGGVTLLVTAKK